MLQDTNFANRHTIASYFARAHLRNGILLGGKEHIFLARADLKSTQLEQAKSRVLASQLASIVKSCWQVSGDELLGFTQEKVKVGMFTLLAERLITCVSLADVYKYTTNFYKVTGEQLQINIAEKDAQVTLSLHINFKDNFHNKVSKSLLSEFLLLICHRFSSWLVGQVIPLIQVHMLHTKPNHHEEYRLMYPCPCTYGCEKYALVFDSKYLTLPVVQNNDELVKYLNQIPLQWFKKQSYYDTYSAQVLRLLETSISHQESTLDYIAAKLNITARTLRRKLTAEGSRFQQLKDNTRRDKAIALFDHANLTIAEIGLSVGYTELATFSRAFKQWTGVSPSIYRNYRSLSTK